LVLAAALAAVVAAACGSSTTESGGDVPIVQIRSLAIAGDVATVTFDASAGGNPVDIVIDWGDGSTTTADRATGSRQAQHVYDLEALTVTEVTVTVEITDDDGNGGRSAAQLQLVGPITTTPGDATTVPEPERHGRGDHHGAAASHSRSHCRSHTDPSAPAARAGDDHDGATARTARDPARPGRCQDPRQPVEQRR
jgi:hypothetical protein